MKQITLFLIAVLSLSCSSTNKIQPVDKNLSSESVQLLEFLHTIQGDYILSGQHNYVNVIVNYTDTAQAITGEIPLVWGTDFSYRGTEDRSLAELRSGLVDSCISKYNQGHIVTLMWHAVRPFDDEPAEFRKNVQGDCSDEQWNELLTENSRLSKRWKAQVDTVAFYLKKIENAGIPVLWRPYHEMNGIWFWWGDRKGPDGYVQLWKMLYQRLTEYHDIHNLIWVWNANAPRDRENDEAYAYRDYFPGIAYVDILSADVYHNDYKQSHHDDLIELAQGKPISLGEVGQAPRPEILEGQKQWTWFMIWARFLTEKNGEDALVELFSTPNVLSRGDVVIDESGKYVIQI